MTTDDLKAVSTKYPTWLLEFPMRTKSGDTFGFEVQRGRLSGYDFGEDYQPETEQSAIFSALLDEIAEEVHGCYLTRDAINGGNADTDRWYWKARSIESAADILPMNSRPTTKLEALLSL